MRNYSLAMFLNRGWKLSFLLAFEEKKLLSFLSLVKVIEVIIFILLFIFFAWISFLLILPIKTFYNPFPWFFLMTLNLEVCAFVCVCVCLQTELNLVFRHVWACVTTDGQRAIDWKRREEKFLLWSRRRAWIEEDSEAHAWHICLQFRFKNLFSAL